MELSPGDVFDRYSICRLKSERLGLENSKELNELLVETRKYENLNFYIDKLYKVNSNIWDLESDIRSGKEKELGLEEIGRRALKIRDLNNFRVQLKNEINSKSGLGYIEFKMSHGSEKTPSVIITLTTVPERLTFDRDDATKMVITSLCEQNDNDYEIHFNIPDIYNVTKQSYIIPEWLNEFKLKYPHLKVFRTKDYGPPTKIVPTLLRDIPDETILLVVDDDLVYHHDMITEHRKNQSEFIDSAICYDGLGCVTPVFFDLRDSWISSIDRVVETVSLQHYKSASYKKKLFEQDFFDYYLGKTFSDDVLISKYFLDKKVKMFVVPYEPETPMFATKELWDLNHGVTTFPVLRHAWGIGGTGCNHPDMLKIQPKFYTPSDLGKKNIVDDIPVVEKIEVIETPVIIEEEHFEYKQPTKKIDFIELMRPVNVFMTKKRIGPNEDGGYVMNEFIFKNCSTLMTYGVGNDIRFEEEFSRQYEKPCYLFDHTIGVEKWENNGLKFIPEGLGFDKPCKEVVTHYNELGLTGDVLLKIDIEGGEYEYFKKTDIKKLSEIVMGISLEIHWIDNTELREKMIEIMTRLSEYFYVFHVHGNNWGGEWHYEGIKLPITLELSFINKKFVENVEVDDVIYPIKGLDIPNNPNLPDYDLDFLKYEN